MDPRVKPAGDGQSESNRSKSALARDLSILLVAVLLAPIGQPCIVLRPLVGEAACRANRRGGHDRELVGGDHLDTGGDFVAGRGAVDHDDSHDLLL